MNKVISIFLTALLLFPNIAFGEEADVPASSLSPDLSLNEDSFQQGFNPDNFSRFHPRFEQETRAVISFDLTTYDFAGIPINPALGETLYSGSYLGVRHLIRTGNRVERLLNIYKLDPTNYFNDEMSYLSIENRAGLSGWMLENIRSDPEFESMQKELLETLRQAKTIEPELRGLDAEQYARDFFQKGKITVEDNIEESGINNQLALIVINDLKMWRNDSGKRVSLRELVEEISLSEQKDLPPLRKAIIATDKQGVHGGYNEMNDSLTLYAQEALYLCDLVYTGPHELGHRNNFLTYDFKNTARLGTSGFLLNYGQQLRAAHELTAIETQLRFLLRMNRIHPFTGYELLALLKEQGYLHIGLSLPESKFNIYMAMHAIARYYTEKMPRNMTILRTFGNSLRGITRNETSFLEFTTDLIKQVEQFQNPTRLLQSI